MATFLFFVEVEKVCFAYSGVDMSRLDKFSWDIGSNTEWRDKSFFITRDNEGWRQEIKSDVADF
jgi:hypothetical protein